ncbi:MAG: YdiU family protein [Nannocystaceae bacterium]
MSVAPAYRPAPRIRELGSEFYDPVVAASFPAHRLRLRNDAHARAVGLDALDDAAWIDHFGRFRALPGNLDEPLALRYHGRQFGVYNPALGDGRGFLFGQVLADDGRLLDLGTKGSGQTPYSRGGDGRLTLKGGVREILAAEFLEAQGVPTCKIFSLIETGERLVRGDEPSPTRASALVRLSWSHLRFGTFERLAYHRERESLARLVEHVVANYHPSARRPTTAASAAALLEVVCAKTAALCARWMVAGFVHGVLNTDNMSLTGESFDYGPWRVMPTYDLNLVAAYFDHDGRYAAGRQPRVCLWNLERLAEALLPVAEAEALRAALAGYADAYAAEVRRAFCERLGVAPRGAARDDALIDAAYALLDGSNLSLDRFFFDWYGGEASRERALAGPAAAAYAERPLFGEFAAALRGYAAAVPERLCDPYYAGARPIAVTIDVVERLWAAIDRDDDWAPLYAAIEELRAAGRLWGNRPGDRSAP